MKLTLLLLILSFSVFAKTGREVMELVKAHNDGVIGIKSKMTMTLIDAHNNKVDRQMLSMTKEGDNENGDKSITEFTRPLDVKGTKLLTHTMKKGANKQWLYLPNFKRVKRINSSSQSGSFMGSEFSYEDIAGQEIDKYTYKLLSEDENIWTIESIPVEDSGYTKLISKISKEKYSATEVQYFDRKGELLKTSVVEGLKPLKVKEKNIFFPDKVTMTNHQTSKKSVIIWSERKVGITLPDSKFKSQKLK